MWFCHLKYFCLFCCCKVLLYPCACSYCLVPSSHFVYSLLDSPRQSSHPCFSSQCGRWTICLDEDHLHRICVTSAKWCTLQVPEIVKSWLRHFRSFRTSFSNRKAEKQKSLVTCCWIITSCSKSSEHCRGAFSDGLPHSSFLFDTFISTQMSHTQS